MFLPRLARHEHDVDAGVGAVMRKYIKTPHDGLSRNLIYRLPLRRWAVEACSLYVVVSGALRQEFARAMFACKCFARSLNITQPAQITSSTCEQELQQANTAVAALFRVNVAHSYAFGVRGRVADYAKGFRLNRGAAKLII